MNSGIIYFIQEKKLYIGNIKIQEVHQEEDHLVAMKVHKHGKGWQMIVPDLVEDSKKDISHWMNLSEEGMGNLFIGHFCNNQYHSEIVDQDSGISDLFSSFTTIES